jgi:hypothetical protein
MVLIKRRRPKSMRAKRRVLNFSRRPTKLTFTWNGEHKPRISFAFTTRGIETRVGFEHAPGSGTTIKLSHVQLEII